MTRAQQLFGALTLFIFCLFASPAAAQDSATIEKVQEHFDRGASLYATGDFDAAIDEFEAGYGLIPDPIFLYNISLAHGKLGRVDESLAVAELAESLGLGEPDNSSNLARKVALRRAQLGQVLSGEVAVERAQKEREAAAAEKERAAEAERARIAEEAKGLSALGWVGIGTMSVGTLAMIGTFVIDVGLAGDVDAYEAAAARGDVTEYNRLQDDIESRQGLGKGLFWGGVGLVAVGSGLLVWDVLSDSADTTASVLPTPDGATVSLSIRY